MDILRNLPSCLAGVAIRRGAQVKEKWTLHSSLSSYHSSFCLPSARLFQKLNLGRKQCCWSNRRLWTVVLSLLATGCLLLRHRNGDDAAPRWEPGVDTRLLNPRFEDDASYRAPDLQVPVGVEFLPLTYPLRQAHPLPGIAWPLPSSPSFSLLRLQGSRYLTSTNRLTVALAQGFQPFLPATVAAISERLGQLARRFPDISFRG